MNVLLSINTDDLKKYIEQQTEEILGVKAEIQMINRAEQIYDFKSKSSNYEMVIVDERIIQNKAFINDIEEMFVNLKYFFFFTKDKDSDVFEKKYGFHSSKKIVFLGSHFDPKEINKVKDHIDKILAEKAIEYAPIENEVDNDDLSNRVNQFVNVVDDNDLYVEPDEKQEESTLEEQTNDEKGEDDRENQVTTESNNVVEDTENQNRQEQIIERRSTSSINMDDIRRKNMDLSVALDIPVWKPKLKRPKIIGIWSPLARTGCTTFTVNFMTHLAQHKIPCAILETLHPQPKLRSILSRYMEEPKDWTSYSHYLFTESISCEKVLWEYNNVHYFPFHEKDLELSWNEQMLRCIIEGLKIHDFSMVDFPSGYMEEHLLYQLQFIDELWIVVNDEIQSFQEWKEHIFEIKNYVPKTKLIFMPEYSFSKKEAISDLLQTDILTTIPSFQLEIMRNNYEDKPLYLSHDDIKDKLIKSYNLITTDIFGSEFALVEKERKKSNKIIDYVRKAFI